MEFPEITASTGAKFGEVADFQPLLVILQAPSIFLALGREDLQRFGVQEN